MGHTQNVTFQELWNDGESLYADVDLHVECKHLQRDGAGGARCAAHGFRGRLPSGAPRREQPRQLGGDRFWVVDQGHMRVRRLPAPRPAARQLPVLVAANGGNPCEGAPCRTSDLTSGAACCRDLEVEIMCQPHETERELLLRSRRSPYLCKVERAGKFSVSAEIISACGYLEPGGVACTLHGRKRKDGRNAKPDMCYEWPPKRKKLHTGCVFASKRRRT